MRKEGMTANPFKKIAAILLGLALLAGAGASAASAADPAGITMSQPATLSQADINAHWSPARMQAADSNQPVAQPGATISAGRAGTGAKAAVGKIKARKARKVRVAPPAAVGFSALQVIQQGWLASANYPNNVGRLYYDTPDGPKVCTATVVDTNLVLTAAHCVWDRATDREHTNFRFVPKKLGTSEPFGSWTRGRALLYNTYRYQGLYSKDYAFIKFQPSSRGNLSTNVGVSYILANPSLSSNLYNLGYPISGAFRKYGGNYIWFCYSPYGGYTSDAAGYTIRMGCMGNGGVSGGPWFHYYNNSWNYVASVNSTCFNSQMHCNDAPEAVAEELRGPYFNNDTLALFRQAQTMQAG
jgi:Ni/Co efflux regulator RcnB